MIETAAPTTTGIIQNLGVIAVSIIAAIFGIQRLLKGWQSTSVETNIITLMHTEIERMSEQNTSLSTEIGKLHTEIITLNNEVRKLSIENINLTSEVTKIKKEMVDVHRVTKRNTNG